ncbi:MAG: tRNA-specific adenosine deaminase [Bacteroidetes bacterium RBG_19FT_COMBO_42_7]|jgi:tRNA(Arg) A34 adenosine deaminase TadA|nr:MAG: tRNA-specific adenosine deaminase [Bacteroidetes bacterium RBG_13_42_15]OFY72943.1 MAG: tRNA-specific adenosine deaminase [Bacteroidetes bacterium RBG_19FT_COMBO_42_7]
MYDDKKFLRKAIEIANYGIKKGCGPFGAVISKDGRIIAESNNKVILNSDPTAHAEILAIREAAVFLRTHDLDGCILYTSCEPCPMCLGAIYWSGIKRVVYASDRRDAAIAGFDDEMIYHEISLDPSKRRITFEQIKDTEAKEVFREWDQYDGKTPY